MKRYLLPFAALCFFIAGYVAHGQTYPRIGFGNPALLITNVIGAGQIGAGGSGTLAFVRSDTNSWTSASSSRTFTSFNVTGGNYLIVAINHYNTPSRTTSVTCNGVNVPLLTSTNWYIDTAGLLSVHGLANPASGDVVVTLSGNAQEGGALAMLFDGVGTIGATTRKAIYVGGYGITNSVASVSGDVIFDAVGWTSPTATRTNLTGQTLIGIGKPAGHYAGVSCSVKAGGASSTTTGWDNEGGVDYLSLIQIVLQIP